MWPMFKKELRENWAYAAAAFALGLLLLHRSAMDYGWYLLATNAVQRPFVQQLPFRTQPLPLEVWTMICICLPQVVAIKLVYEEQWRRTWPLLAQLPVSRGSVIWAKFLAGLAIYAAVTLCSAGVILLRLAIPGAWPGPFLPGDGWALALPFPFGVCAFCLAFFCAHRPARWYATKWLPLMPAMFALLISSTTSSGYSQTHTLRGAWRFLAERMGPLRLPVLLGPLAAAALAVLALRIQSRTREY